MKKNWKYIVLVLIVVLAAWFIFMPKSNSNSEIVLTAKESQTTFNPFKVDNVSDNDALQQAVATLTKYNKDGQVVNNAAENITMSSDQKEVNIKLKNNLAFEDGTKITAKDYYLGAKVFADPKTASSYASWILDWVVGAKDYANKKSQEISGYKIKDDYNFTIKLVKPVPFFTKTLVNTYWAPVTQKQLDDAGGIEKYGTSYDKFVASGPFKIKKFVAEQYIEFISNDKSGLKQDNIKQFKIKYIKDNKTIVDWFKKEQVNSVVKTEDTDKILGYKKDKQADYIDNSPNMTWLVVNSKSVDSNMAKAIYLALDKNYINDNFYYSQNKIRSIFTPQNINFDEIDKNLGKNNIEVNDNLFNLEEAKKLIEKTKSNKNLNLMVSSEKMSETKYANMIKYIQQQLKQIGINVNINATVAKLARKEVLQEESSTRKYDITIDNWAPDYLEASSYTNSVLGSKTGTNYGNWSNVEYDSNNDIAMSSNSSDVTSEKYAKNVKMVKENGVLQPIFQTSQSYYIKKDGYKTYKNGLMLLATEWFKN